MDNRDIELAEQIGGMSAKIETLNTSIVRVENKLDKYIERHDKEHTAMWKRIDSHGKWINGAKAVIAVIATIVGYGLYLLKAKVL